MAKKEFVNRNNALQRSNAAHTRLSRVMLERRDLVSSDYHSEVCIKQHNQNRILTKKERKWIFNKIMNRHGVY